MLKIISSYQRYEKGNFLCGEVTFLFCLTEIGANYVNRISQCVLNGFFSLKGKTAIVTGGNSGLGQAFAMALAKAGAMSLFLVSSKITAKQRK